MVWFGEGCHIGSGAIPLENVTKMCIFDVDVSFGKCFH